MSRVPTSTTKSASDSATRVLVAPLLALSVLALLVGSLVLPSPFARGQGDAAFSRYERVPRGTPCPAGTTAAGDLQFDGFGLVIDDTYCRPNGTGWVTDRAQCDLASTLFPGDLIVHFPQIPLCAIDGVPVAPGLSCGPLVRAQGPGFFIQGGVEIRFGGCLVPLLAPEAPRGPAGVPVCIESDLVQQNTAAAGLSVGSSFPSGGITYLITTGAPSCSFHCADGFDANCDNKLGDYCPSGLDLRTVRDVGLCLAALAPAPPPASVPVESVNASIPLPGTIALPVPATGPQIAHTGAESSVLAFIGTGLIAFGALALGIRRRLD